MTIEPGRTATLDLRVEFQTQPDPVPAPVSYESPPREVRVEVSGLPDGSAGTRVRVIGWIPDGERLRLDTTEIAPGTDEVLGAEWRGARRVVVAARGWLVSEPVDVDDRDRVVAALRPGGLLVVVHEDAMEPGGGALRVLPADGRPPWGFHGESGVAGAPEAGEKARMGSILGPFPAGTHRFRVWWGRHRLPDAVAEVRAGRATPLVIRR